MSKVFLHIGLHKTGTTALQKNYFPYLQDITYIPTKKTFAEIPKNPFSKDVLLSYESLSGIPWNLQWLKGKRNQHSWFNSFKVSINNLKIIFPNAHIIIMFRRHGDLLISLYKQYVQEGGRLKLEEFYNENGVIKDSDLIFSDRIRFLKSNFRNVDVLNYEKFKISQEDYLNAYFNSRGFSEIIKSKIQARNVSISEKKIEILRRINPYYDKLPEIIQRVMKHFQLTPRELLQHKFSFWNTADSPEYEELRKRINEKFSSDFEFVEKLEN